MKKFLSLLLAVLMVALSVFSVAGASSAEETPAAGTLQLSVPDMSSTFGNKAFATKYMEEGQREVIDVSFQLGENVTVMIPEELRAVIEQVLSALKIQSSTQVMPDRGQQAIRVLLNDESVFDVLVAVGEKGLYLTSNVMGDKVLQVTAEQINKAVKKVLKKIRKAEKAQQADETGTLMETIQSLLAELGILSAVENIVNGMTVQTVADVQPADALFKPMVVMTVPVTKEALTDITTALGISILSLAEAQKPVGMEFSEQSEEELMAGLNSLPEKLADDIELRIYLDETGKKVQIGLDLTINQDDGSLLPVSVAALIETRDDGTDIIAAISMNQYGIENRIDCEITMKTEGNQGSLNGTAVVTVSDGEQKTVPMQGTGSLTWIDEETARNAQGEIRAEILNSDAPQALYMTMDFTDKDLGDHAKTDLVFTVGLAEGGALLTIKVDGKTDLAEAYIITDDAVDVAKMDEETSQALRNELQVGAAQVLSNLMTKLPEAAQQLLAQIMGGTQQASPAK